MLKQEWNLILITQNKQYYEKHNCKCNFEP